MRLAPETPAAGAADPRLADATRSMEAVFLRQIIKSSGAFSGGATAGSSVREDMFVDALADAVARSGGIGIAAQLQRSLSPHASGAAAAPPSPGAPPAPPGLPAVAVTPRTTAGLLGAEPVAGPVTSAFGERTDPFTGAHAEHDGVDVGAPEGTPIRAPAAGVVLRAGPRGGYGNAVEIDHGNGVVTVYGHASELLVKPGDAVAAGQEIATVGSTGRSTGPHLHFEVRMGGRPVDPARVLKVYSRRAEDVSRSGP